MNTTGGADQNSRLVFITCFCANGHRNSLLDAGTHIHRERRVACEVDVQRTVFECHTITNRITRAYFCSFILHGESDIPVQRPLNIETSCRWGGVPVCARKVNIFTTISICVGQREVVVRAVGSRLKDLGAIRCLVTSHLPNFHHSVIGVAPFRIPRFHQLGYMESIKEPVNSIPCRGDFVIRQVSPHWPCFIEHTIGHFHVRHCDAVVHTTDCVDGIFQDNAPRLSIRVLTRRNNRLTKRSTFLRTKYLIACLVDVEIYFVSLATGQIREDVLPNESSVFTDDLVHDVRGRCKLTDTVGKYNGCFCIASVDIATQGQVAVAL